MSPLGLRTATRKTVEVLYFRIGAQKNPANSLLGVAQSPKKQ
jgi:hypothetical protein